MTNLPNAASDNPSDVIITAIEARAVNVPIEYPVQTSVGLVSTAPLVLIDLHTNVGVVGRSYVFTYTPIALKATQAMVQGLAEIVKGKGLSPVALDALIAQRMRLIGRTGIALMASSGIDMAAWDALAIIKGMPLVQLLGGEPRPIPVYDSHSMDGEKLGVERASRSRESGYKAIKTKIGYATLNEDIKIVRALRKAISDDVELMVDYNQGLTRTEAVKRGLALSNEGISWIEEPVLQDDYASHALIREKLSVPIQMGENWCGIEDMTKALDAGACDLCMPDPMKIGGVTGWMRASALAQSRGIQVSSHIFQEVSVHLLAVTPTAHWLERMDLAAPVLEEPLNVVNGFATAKNEPGTGIRWNESAVAKFLR